MNIKSHLEKIKQQIVNALSNEKDILISEFLDVLQYSSRLLKTDRLIPWKNQIKKEPWNLIPTTKWGVEEELKFWQDYQPTLKTLLYHLERTSEKILVYWIKDDLCDMQGQFFYYKEAKTNKVFKESELGNLEGIELKRDDNIRVKVALIPDLSNSCLVKRNIQNDMYQ